MEKALKREKVLKFINIASFFGGGGGGGGVEGHSLKYKLNIKVG